MENNQKKNLESQVHEFLKTIPKGKVVTYGQIAKKFGISNARFVSKVLRAHDLPDEIPCFRVVRSNGTLADGYGFGGIKEQSERLRKDGIKVWGNKILEFKKYLFEF